MVSCGGLWRVVVSCGELWYARINGGALAAAYVLKKNEMAGDGHIPPRRLDFGNQPLYSDPLGSRTVSLNNDDVIF